jgi:hypothetical protein
MQNRTSSQTVEEFLKSDKLKRADVMLSRGKKSFFSKLIMWGTRSNWSHAALVFAIPKPEEGFDNTFVIESVGDGVDITNLRYYVVDHADEYDVAIKRLEAEWFSNEEQGLAIRRRVRGSMLNFIKAEYDFSTIFQIALMVLRKILFGIRARYTGFEQAIRHTYKKKRLVPSQFICSGFVQYGFYDTIRNVIKEKQLPPERLQEVIFNARFTRGDDIEVLLSTTPEELAATDKLAWKYVIKGGRVYDVSRQEDVRAILNQK